jgi:acetyl-CoA carboxylase biotin carboxyl carrier protein
MKDEIIERIKELVAIMKENNLKSIEIESDDFSIRLEGNETINLKKEIQKEEVDKKEGDSSIKKETEEADKYFIIKAPLIGTFYRSPSPDSPPFVSVGDIVVQGQTLCIIEAMKVMNEIVSERDGKIVQIFPENGEMVEFGKSLFKIELVKS